jgi:hypothetical protein
MLANRVFPLVREIPVAVSFVAFSILVGAMCAQRAMRSLPQ